MTIYNYMYNVELLYYILLNIVKILYMCIYSVLHYISILMIYHIQPYVLQCSNNSYFTVYIGPFFILIAYRGSREVKNNSLQSDRDAMIGFKSRFYHVLVL